MTTTHFEGPLAPLWRASTGTHTLDRRLPVPAATDRGAWDPDSGWLDVATRADVTRRAAADAGTPWPATTAHAYARYWRDGNRTEYEDVVASRQRRLGRAVVAAASTLDPQWIDEVADGVTAVCEQSSWCWAAHDDTRTKHGAVVPTVTDPYLDLGAGELAGQLAWIDQVLADPLDERYPGLRARIRHEVTTRVLEPFRTRRDWHWLGLDGDVHNWNPWIHGNVLAAALRLAEPEARDDVVDLVVEGLDRYVASLPEDGAIDEGYSYWWNGACRAIEALDLLQHATGGTFDPWGIPSLVATVSFPHRMHLGGGWYLNVADGPARPPDDQPWAALFRAAGAMGDHAAAAHAAARRRPGAPVADEGAGLGRLLRALTDRAWSEVGSVEMSGRSSTVGHPLPRDVWLPSTQVLVARGAAGSTDGLGVAVKGGHNGEHHNHCDVGSFVVTLGGVPVIVDPGRPTYTAQTFGPDRYDIWTMGSAWHNVPEVAGHAQGVGPAFRSRKVAVSIDDADDGCVTWSGDLGAAYPKVPDEAWRRAVTFHRGHDVTVTDTWNLNGLHELPPDGSSRLHLVLAGEVEVDDVGARVRALDGAGTVLITWTGDVAHVETERRDLVDPALAEVWGAHLVRLTLTLADTVVGAAGVHVREVTA